ncbi:caspase family protein [Streptomyces sp. NPDC088261]|uniref:caspase, EACC1-associated type n=1 Tax=Streptomyces sp. NPDC088261 TaxID=3365851 RepID=UPI003804EFDF
MSMPSPSGSRAVLIGVSTYDHLNNIPNIERNLTDLRNLLTGPRSWNLPEEHCLVLSNPAHAHQVLSAVQNAAQEATDALLIYYSGHGQIDADGDELFLTVPGSRPHTMWTGIEYKHMRREIQKSRARLRVVILDCCYAGRITAMGDRGELVEKAAAEGTFLLAASPPTEAALSYPEEPHTAFTGELLSVLNHGVPDGPALLDAGTAFHHVRRNLIQRDRPRPSMKASNTAGAVPLAVNAQYSPPHDARPLPHRTPPQETPAPPADNSADFAKRPGGCAMFVLVLVLTVLVFATWGISTGDLFYAYKASKAQEPVEDPSDAVVAYSVLAAVCIGWLGHRRLLRPYGLRISEDGIQVRAGNNGLTHYPWHRIVRAGVEWEPTRRRGRGRFCLNVRLREGTPSQLSWSARRAHRREGRDTIRLSVLDRLNCAPRDVDQALNKFAPRGVWTPTHAAQRPKYAAPEPDRPPTELRGKTRRVRLGLLTLVLAGAALAPCLIILTTVPAYPYGWETVGLALWTLVLLLPPLVPALLLRCSGSLVIGADGITHTTAHRRRHWSWDRVERVGVMSWLRNTPTTGVLFLTTREPGSPSPATGLRKILGRVEARLGGELVCDLVSLGISRKQVEAAIRQHTEDVWDDSPRPEHGVIQDDEHAAHYEGSFVGLRTLGAIGATALVYVGLIVGVVGPLADHQAASRMFGAVVVYTLVILICLTLLPRKPLTVRIDDRALSLSSGARQLIIPWEHVNAVGPVATAAKKKAYDTLVVWLNREEASRYRGYWRLGAQLTDVRLHVASVRFGAGALSISPERLDDALRRFARERYHSGTTRPDSSNGEAARGTA